MNLYLNPEKLKERCKDPLFCIVCFCSRHDVPVDNHHVCSECRQGSKGMPRRLPVVTLKNAKSYFVDKRLRELRNILAPYESIDFDYLRRLINMNPNPDAIITVSCTTCGKILFEGSRRQAKGLILYCVDC